MKEVIDCHYCEYAWREDENSPVDCCVEDGCYFDYHVKDSKAEAENCGCFEFCGIFPKF